jgi:hypothetical protein
MLLVSVFICVHLWFHLLLLSSHSGARRLDAARRVGYDASRRKAMPTHPEDATMQQVKLFKGVENQIDQLEANVNAWIRKAGATVVSVSGNIAPQTVTGPSESAGLTQSDFPPSDVLLIVVYDAPNA